MPVIATIFSIVLGFLQFVIYALLVWVILSWILLFTRHSSARWRYRGLFHALDQIDYFLRMFLGPFLRLARRILPPRILPREWQFIDFSPIVVVLMIVIVRALLVWLYGLILFRS